MLKGLKNGFQNKKTFICSYNFSYIIFAIIGKSLWKYEGYTISKHFDFSRKQLIIATPYDIGGACHPKIVYFENGFNNYKYQMAYTP